MTVAPSRVVRLAAGGFLWDGAPVVVTADSSAPIVVNVPATDGTEILAADRSTFEYVVTIESRSSRHPGRGVHSREFRGMLPTSLGASASVADLGDATVVAALPRAVPAGTDLDTVTSLGPWSVGDLTITNRPPVEAYGALEVMRSSAATIIQRYTTIQSVHEVYLRRGNSNGTGWTAWQRVDGSKFTPGLLSSTTDLNAVVTPGMYGVASTSNANRPVAINGTVTVATVGVGVVQTYTTVGSVPQIWVRRGNTDGTGWFAWVRVDAGASAVVGEVAGPARRDLLIAGLTARKGGRIGTNGKGVIGLRFDDAAGEFTAKVLPLLIERRLPFTRVTTTDRTTSPLDGTPSWAQVQDELLANGGEVWNHGKSHGNATGTAALDAEIVGALDTLRTNLPRVPVDCWAPPGGSASVYDGHLPSSTVTAWADTYAGRLILGNHALASGYLPDTYYRPIDGRLRDGQVHYTNDARTVVATKDLVDRARDWKVGVVLMWHAHNLDQPGQQTTADLAAVLDYVAAQRDAGNIVVLTLSGMAVADRSSSHRDNILTTSSGSPFTETVVFPQFRQGIPGSTRELTATVTGTPGATVTSTVGAATRTHTIPAGGTLTLRHPVTIPLDVTSLTVSITGGATTGAALVAV